MPLENEPLKETEAAVPRLSDAAKAGQSLSQDEMSQLLDIAIARHSQAQQYGGDSTTIADAVDVARQLGIPEEHVYAAAEELQRRKQIQSAEQAAAEQRLFRVKAEKERRRGAFFKSLAPLWLGIGACAVLGALTGHLLLLWAGGVLLGLPLLFLLFRWLGPVTDDEASHADLAPKSGVCRVCGRTATTPRSTFCEEHRWRGPAG